MSGMREPSGRGRKTSLLQWLLFTPLVVVLFAGIGLYIYISYFNPSLGRGEHLVTTQVLDRVELTLPDGKLDLKGSYLLVRIEGREMKLRPALPVWTSVANGDTLEVEVGRSTADGSPVAYSYKRVAPAPTSRDSH